MPRPLTSNQAHTLMCAAARRRLDWAELSAGEKKVYIALEKRQLVRCGQTIRVTELGLVVALELARS